MSLVTTVTSHSTSMGAAACQWGGGEAEVSERRGLGRKVQGRGSGREREEVNAKVK
jgi:hypothetical protein